MRHMRWLPFVILGALALGACASLQSGAPEATVREASAVLPSAVSGPVQLLAGQDMAVGVVSVSNDTGELCVTYALSDEALGDGWRLRETHLYVGASDDFPLTPQNARLGGPYFANPVPGRFPYGDDALEGETAWTQCIGLADLGVADGDTVFIAAHAVIERETEPGVWEQESAWGDGERFNVRGNWGLWFSYSLDAEPEPLTVEVSVDLPDPSAGDIGADVMFNVDLSGSYFDDLVTFRNQAAAIVAALNDSVADLRVGITSFVDAPCSSFGSQFAGDYGHRLDLALTDSLAAFQTTLDGLRVRNGGDLPESQLESMYQSMTGTGFVVAQGTTCDGVADIAPSAPGWAPERLRFLLHATDAAFHRPGDIGSGSIPYPYPTDVDDVIDVAQATGTRIFFLDAGGTTDAAKGPIADATGGQVFLLGSDSSGVVDAVRDAVEGAVSAVTIRLVPSAATEPWVESIDPDAYLDVDLTTVSSLPFQVTFVPAVQPGPVDQVFTFFLSVDGAVDEANPIEVTIPAQP